MQTIRLELGKVLQTMPILCLGAGGGDYTLKIDNYARTVIERVLLNMGFSERRAERLALCGKGTVRERFHALERAGWFEEGVEKGESDDV